MRVYENRMTLAEVNNGKFQGQLGKSDGSKVSKLETSAWQRRSIARSNSRVKSKLVDQIQFA